MTTEQIAAIGTIVIGLVTALFTFLNARQGKRISELMDRVGKLEQELEAAEGFGRAAKLYVLRILRWRDQVEVATAAADLTLPAFPEPPALVAAEL